jgi:galactokinase
MTGAGFGGCTVNLVEADRVESFKEIVGEAYKDATKLSPRIFVCAPGAGVGELEF